MLVRRAWNHSIELTLRRFNPSHIAPTRISTRAEMNPAGVHIGLIPAVRRAPARLPRTLDPHARRVLDSRILAG
jgi:hypothetical protein